MALEEYYLESTAALAIRIDQLVRVGRGGGGRGTCQAADVLSAQR